MRKQVWTITVTSDYLGKTKTFRAYSEQEAELIKTTLVQKWDAEEQRLREREVAKLQKASKREQALCDTQEAQELITAYRSLLEASLRVNHRLDWESLKNREQFSVPPPTLDRIAREMNVPPQDKVSEFLFPAKKYARLAKEAGAKALNERCLKEHGFAKQEFEQKQEEYNNSIDKLKKDFEADTPEAIEQYVCRILGRSKYPDGFEKAFEAQYDSASETLLVSFELPSKVDLPNVIEYKYLASRDEVTTVRMKEKDFAAYYEDCLYQIFLRTTHEVFAAPTSKIKSVVFNGWVTGTDPKTGNEFHACVISCQSPRKEFETYNLKRVSPKECFRNLKGLAAGPLAELAPVRPILILNKEDPRFVQSREVLGNLDATTNLATMDWEDFEHLVRQLFEKVFLKNGGEVKVTQASRDGGVDAIAFDPDPIRGGKFVIQAKRYNNVVPVSAVRDLYGTMIAEGASKGILVTTSYYGNDAREFAKDKPITLVDGSNLVYMFQEYGYNVTVQLQTKEK